MHGGSPLRSAPGADRSGHGDAEPAGSSHQPSRVFNVYICSARLPPCACSLACYSSNGIFQPQSTSRPSAGHPHARPGSASSKPSVLTSRQSGKASMPAPCVGKVGQGRRPEKEKSARKSAGHTTGTLWPEASLVASSLPSQGFRYFRSFHLLSASSGWLSASPGWPCSPPCSLLALPCVFTVLGGWGFFCCL